MDSFQQEARPQTAGSASPQINSNWPMGTHSAMHASYPSPPHTPLPLPGGQLPGHDPDNVISGLWQTASEHTQKVGSICRPGREHTLELLGHMWENKRKAASTESGTMQDPGKAYNFQNSATRGSKKRGASRCSLRKSEKASESLAGLMEALSLPNAVSKNCRRSLRRHACKTSRNMKNQSNMATPKNHKNLVNEPKDKEI